MENSDVTLGLILERIQDNEMAIVIRRDRRTASLRVEIRGEVWKDAVVIDLEQHPIRSILQKIEQCQLCIIELDGGGKEKDERTD